VIQIDAADTGALVAEVTSGFGGRVTMVAGHSDTVPELIDRLGGSTITSIPESKYDNMFVVVIPRVGSTKVVRLKYGPPT
jgi:hypothetical protein